jgi:hypothetical protein
MLGGELRPGGEQPKQFAKYLKKIPPDEMPEDAAEYIEYRYRHLPVHRHRRLQQALGGQCRGHAKGVWPVTMSYSGWI